MKRFFYRIYVVIFVILLAFALQVALVGCSFGDCSGDGHCCANPDCVCNLGGLSSEQLFDMTAKKTVLVSAGGQMGSGIIVASKDGFIDVVTNFHVVFNGGEIEQNIQIKILDVGGFIDAKVVGFVESYDICVLRGVYLGEIDVFVLGGSTSRVGQQVLAVGYNGGVIGAYDGIVSANAKTIFNKSLNRNLVVTQTTAPFAEGCSGGAIVGADGGLIGLSSYILLAGGGGETVHTGLSYGIPSAIVESAYGRIVADYPCGTAIGEGEGGVAYASGVVVGENGVVTVANGNYLFDVEVFGGGLRVFNAKLGAVNDGDVIKKINGIELNTADRMVVFIAQVVGGYDNIVLGF